MEERFNDMDLQIPAAPSLTFGEPLETAEARPAVPVVTAADQPKVQEVVLTPEEQEMVDRFAEQIDVTNTQAVMSYGAGTQKKMADFSEKAIGNVRTKDMGEVGSMITSLVTELKSFDVEEEKKGIMGLFKKNTDRMAAMKAKYTKVETNITEISRQLEQHQITLLKDMDVLDKMYGLNLTYFKELTMYVMAGKKKLEEVRATDLKALQDKAQASGLVEDAQEAKDLAAQCDRFEKKIHDLELTRTIALQTAPQIRMVQASDAMMAEKIQSTIVNTIPLWKNQMVIAIGIDHAAQAARAEREVNDTTNALLKKNAEALKTATVAGAKEAERGIVDIETLKHTNELLIGTLDEVLTIQKEGKEKRQAAQAELADIENQLKQKLLEATYQ